MAAVAREAEVTDIGRGEEDGLGRAERLAGFFVDRHSPEVERSTSVAPEIEIAAIRRPDGVPVGRDVVGDLDRLTTDRRDRPDVTPSRIAAQSPVGNAVAVR